MHLHGNQIRTISMIIIILFKLILTSSLKIDKSYIFNQTKSFIFNSNFYEIYFRNFEALSEKSGFVCVCVWLEHAFGSLVRFRTARWPRRQSRHWIGRGDGYAYRLAVLPRCFGLFFRLFFYVLYTYVLNVCYVLHTYNPTYIPFSKLLFSSIK